MLTYHPFLIIFICAIQLIMSKGDSKENIFSWKKRTQQDFIKNPLRFSRASEDDIENKLKEQGQKNLESFDRFLEKHFAIFDNKINKCKLKCAEKSRNYAQNRKCYNECGTGLNTFRRFVDSRVGEMQKLLGQCVDNAQKLTDSLYETYYCFQLYNKSYQHLKTVIKEQSLYYE